ncbi:ribosome-inactivating family protein [Streptomyces sp. ID05-04B]|uniref:ribosome-inactivating family protein n=1 Tax=unclassified Streptomyces TaxID=2593676 RepID=UPI000D1A9ED7|nr:MULTISPECIES: ribosome-inactivating family protein [unclassified Streptomyces]AVV41490.1 hypothetical protein C6376_08610 [Streptomyces sp. P3]MDX5569864.1 ribosome-inactivating family protein [Streptomyces sp. ID05-04B]
MHHADTIEARPGQRPRRITVTSIVAAIVLSVFATLLGPLGTLQTASAADGNPTFRVGTDDSSDYTRFIDAIRDRISDGSSSDVVKAHGYRVYHTPTTEDPKSTNAYLRVDIQAWGNDHFVRLNLRRSNLYLLGWWDKHDTYHYMGTRNGPGGKPHEAESSRWDNGKWRKSKKQQQTSFGENYVALERITGRPRTSVGISRGTINAAVWDLYNSASAGEMAWGALVMTQFIPEAVRIRPQRDGIAPVMGHAGGTWNVTPACVEIQNNWGTLSKHFNDLNREDHKRRDGKATRDSHPLVGWLTDGENHLQKIILETAFLYATYILNTSLGR